MQHAAQMVKYPDPDGDPQDLVVEFRARKKQHRLPFYLVCDFECFLQPVNTDNTDVDGDGDGDFVTDASSTSITCVGLRVTA